MNLADRILTFIGYCLPEIGFKFSYKKMADAFATHYKINYSIKTLRKEFSLLKKAGFIIFKKRYRKPYPTLSQAGKLKISPRLPYKKYGHWDGKWRIIISNIPPKEKKYKITFKKKLDELGFKKIREGVFISPHPLFSLVNRISSDLGIRQYLILIETPDIDREKPTIQKIWGLWAINEEYRNFIKKAKKAKKITFWPLLAKNLEEEFYKIYKKDPHLPSELLPSGWLGEKAYKIYKEIVHSY